MTKERVFSERFFEFGKQESAAQALYYADMDLMANPSLGSEIGKQLRRDAGDYLWRSSLFNVIRAGTLVLLGLESLQFAKWTDTFGSTLLGTSVGIATEAKTLWRSGRVFAGSFRY